MTYETYKMMCYICAGAGSILFIVTIFLFFKLKIVKVIADITGSAEKKGIRNIENQSMDNATKLYSTGGLNNQHSSSAGKIPNDIKSVNSRAGMNANKQTAKLNQKEFPRSSDEFNKTTILSADELFDDSNKTTVLKAEDLYQNSDETTVLVQNQMEGFRIEYEIQFVHTGERIM